MKGGDGKRRGEGSSGGRGGKVAASASKSAGETDTRDVLKIMQDTNLHDDSEMGNNLVLLASNGFLDKMKSVITAGLRDVNDGDTSGYTPLMAASSYGKLGIVEYLVSVPNIDVNQVDSDGDSALHYCTDLDCMKILLDAGGNHNLRNSEGLTPAESMEKQLSEDEDDSTLGSSERARLKLLVEYFRSETKG